MSKTIVVIGAGRVLSPLLILQIKKLNGSDVEVISNEVAEERGIMIKKEKIFVLTPPPIFKEPEIYFDKYQAKRDCKKGWKK